MLGVRCACLRPFGPDFSGGLKITFAVGRSHLDFRRSLVCRLQPWTSAPPRPMPQRPLKRNAISVSPHLGTSLWAKTLAPLSHPKPSTMPTFTCTTRVPTSVCAFVGALVGGLCPSGCCAADVLGVRVAWMVTFLICGSCRVSDVVLVPQKCSGQSGVMLWRTLA